MSAHRRVAVSARGRRRLATALAVASAVGVGAAFAPGGGPAPGLHGGARARVALAAVSAPGRGTPLPGTRRVTFDLVLRVDTHARDVFLRRLFEAGAPGYERYLTPAQFGRRFGLRPAAQRALVRRLSALGLRVQRTYPQRTSLSVTASAATVRRVFGVVLRSYRLAGVAPYHAPDRTPGVPATLGRWVTGVAGLSTRAIARTDYLPAASGGALRPTDVRSAYDVLPLYQVGVRGAGQTIDVISLDNYSAAGFKRFSQVAGLPTTPPKIVTLEKPQINDGAGESSLDLEVIHQIAPQARIVDYQVAFQDLPDAINRIVARHDATIVSSSFGTCDTTGADPSSLALPASLRRDTENALSAAVATGMTFVFSTGDAGAYQCSREDPSDHRVSVEFPSDAPYTLAVGGTVLSIDNAENYAGESAWGDAASIAGGGGGLNPYDRAPSWQSAVGVPGVSTGARQSPDVSAAAGAGSPWYVNNGSSQGGGWITAYGTSAAAPFWAASLVLVQGFLTQHHLGPLCFATPLIYDVAEGSWRYPPFHDVTSGSNLYYEAGPGWDFATGWGSPDLASLAADTASYRHDHPLPAGRCS